MGGGGVLSWLFWLLAPRERLSRLSMKEGRVEEAGKKYVLALQCQFDSILMLKASRRLPRPGCTYVRIGWSYLF